MCKFLCIRLPTELLTGCIVTQKVGGGTTSSGGRGEWVTQTTAPAAHPSKAAASPTEVLSGVALTTEGAPHGACLNA